MPKYRQNNYQGNYKDPFVGTAENLEIAAMLGTGLIGDAVGGVNALIGGDAQGNPDYSLNAMAGRIEDKQQEFTYQPRLPGSQDKLASIGQGIQKIGEYLRPARDLYERHANRLIGPTAAGTLYAGTAALADVAGPGKVTRAVPTTGPVGVPTTGRRTVQKGQRKAFPGIYAPPDQIAKYIENTKVAPESPMLSRLFGVTREDLAKGANVRGRPGVIPGAAATPKGADAAFKVMGPANTRRLTESLLAAREHAPRLFDGMTGWYNFDPAYHRILQLVDGDQLEANRLYTQLINLSSAMSPGSSVVTELKRGTAANMLAEAGRFDEFQQYGGKPLGTRGHPDLETFPGHPYHSTAQAPGARKFLETGQIQSKEPKVGLYNQATEVGGQTDIAVPDAHFSRAVGLADTRNPQTRKGQQRVPGDSASVPEIQTLAPWWREEVARQAGLEAVPAQAVAWGLFSDATGVATAVGAPKLEILSDLIDDTAKRLKVTPEEARDRVLLAQAQAGFADPKLLALIVPPAVVGTLIAMPGDDKRNALDR
ncbi:MAG: hypothetical protein GOVbin7744_36 [Prokaryotic dsDNA virus sp.]|nr:MAG: hypothetical protein GOVbin7744_36 [Prokaryotic dsDNA virus sp.]|tara:strand:+ start:18805 stop:20421 length:1617 start_codon:yes stop_codon:yes gene_type:complete